MRPGQVPPPAPARTDRVVTPAGAVGESAPRPDGVLKVTGEFAYSSDLWADHMLWGATLRSPHPRARIRSIDVSGAQRMPGVHAVLTHQDVPGAACYGLDLADQPVLAIDQVRYRGEPVALVAADDPDTARRALARISVDYQVLTPVTDALAAWRGEADPVHPGGNLVRHQPVRRGDPNPSAAVVVRGEYRVGMQDQACLGPESGLAIPCPDGGVEMYVATQWLHVDRQQMAPCLNLPEDKVRLTLAGVGGAFGAREDLSVQIHAGMLALHIGRPVKMVYGREESFVGHVHRHPAWMRYEHGADPDGRLVYARAEIVLDGGAYASSTAAVVGNAATLGIGPYRVPNVSMDAYGVYTNNPPCGAMRGFGVVQAAFAHESQLDKLAAALRMDPVEVRIRNAVEPGAPVATGQVVDQPAPVVELLERVRAAPLPEPPALPEPWHLPGGLANTTHGEAVRRGVGYGTSIKNVGYSEGMDDYATAGVRLYLAGGEPTVAVHTAAVEVGQGVVTVQAQVARTELGVARVVVLPADTTVGSAGSTSASRQTYLTGGAVKAACEAIRDRLRVLVEQRLGHDCPQVRLAGADVVGPDGVIMDLPRLLGDEVIEETAVFRHRPTEQVDPGTGQGRAHVQHAFCAVRAVVDVDVELGLVRVVELAVAQDVGLAVNPQAVHGQIHGGSAQGLGLALMEEMQVVDGVVRNPSFTDYLLPTTLDMPPVRVELLELPDPAAPYGVRGVGEPPAISTMPAIVAAIRDATGLELDRVPVRPEHIALAHRG